MNSSNQIISDNGFVKYPKNCDQVVSLNCISGIGCPGNLIVVFIDDYLPLTTRVEDNCEWQIAVPYTFKKGWHRIYAKQEDLLRTIYQNLSFEVGDKPICIPPSIETPCNNSIIFNRQPVISGMSDPDSTILINLNNYSSIATKTNSDGFYQIQWPKILDTGTYKLSVQQRYTDNTLSDETIIVFAIKNYYSTT